MTARNGEGVYGDGVGVVSPLAHKLSQNGPLVKDSTGQPRSGIFYAGAATLVTGKASMAYDVAAFEAAICRARTKGTSFPTNDSPVTVATTAAPGANSRIDIIYVQQAEVSEGDPDTEAVIGVVQGTAASSPTAPSLPDGAIELARAVVGAGITGTQDAVITQTAPFTAAAGGVIPFRSSTERDVFSPAEGQLGWLLDVNRLEVFNGVGWEAPGVSDWVSWTTPPTGITVGSGGSASQRYKMINGRALVQYRFVLGSSGASIGTDPYLTLPFNISLPVPRYAILPGDGNLFDLSTTLNYYTKARVNDPSSNQVRISSYTGSFASITASAPFAWAAGDIIQGEFWVDPA